MSDVVEIVDGSFSVMPDEQKDAFRHFGLRSKIRTPVELTYPGHITVGDWVSLGRYGKIVMLPEQAFESSEAMIQQHYPELLSTLDRTIWDVRRPADLQLGDGTSLGDRYFIICTESVKIGKHVMSSANTFISDCHHIYDTEVPPILLPVTKGKPVVIEDHVWIGINCCILEGVTVGKHAVIGANSVVRDDVPPYTVVAGAPAKVVKRFKTKLVRGDS